MIFESQGRERYPSQMSTFGCRGFQAVGFCGVSVSVIDMTAYSKCGAGIRTGRLKIYQVSDFSSKYPPVIKLRIRNSSGSFYLSRRGC